MTTKKTTKKTYFATLSALVADAQANDVGLPEGVSYEGINEFIAHEVELLDKKADAAAKRAENKRNEGDALREKIASVLTDEFQTINEIVVAIGDSQITNAMVTPRLAQLVQLGLAEKDMKNVPTSEGGKSRKISAYKRA